MMILVFFFSIYKNREVARCFHGYRNYAPHSDITRYQNLCTIPSSSRICIQIPLAYPALPNWHFQILPLYYEMRYVPIMLTWRHGLVGERGGGRAFAQIAHYLGSVDDLHPREYQAYVRGVVGDEEPSLKYVRNFLQSVFKQSTEKLHPSTSHNQPKAHYFLLNRQTCTLYMCPPVHGGHLSD